MFRSIFVCIFAIIFVCCVSRGYAHCDRLDGPVIKAAQAALVDGDVVPVLIWVQEKDEEEIRAAFKHVTAVRKLGPEAKQLADRFFFETSCGCIGQVKERRTLA